jgi:DNA invertase Pin-like site-specific DNA recombinase
MRRIKMTYFYTRVSTKDQNLARQLAEAKSYKNVDEVFCDKQSGKTYDRPEYERLKSVVCEGDEVIVKEMDRLGRNKTATKEEIKWFKEHGIILRILELPTTLIDFNGQEWIADMINNMLIEVLTTIAEQEVKKIDRRRAEGIAAMPVVNGKKVSLKTGRAYGRQPIEVTGEFEKFLEKQKRGEISVAKCCEALHISRSTWYNKVAEVG